jgi:septum formation protein
MFTLSRNLILGSKSPRRRYIFDMIGLEYQCKEPVFIETMPEECAAEQIPEYLARQKALSLSSGNDNDLVISFDTVVLFQGRILGKPADRNEALEMLRQLNGNRHIVFTGVALACGNKIVESGNENTEVTFRSSGEDVLQKYVDSSEPLDKAGSYGIQGKGAVLVEKIKGCYYNVMGVPMHRTLRILEPFLNK